MSRTFTVVMMTGEHFKARLVATGNGSDRGLDFGFLPIDGGEVRWLNTETDIAGMIGTEAEVKVAVLHARTMAREAQRAAEVASGRIRELHEA